MKRVLTLLLIAGLYLGSSQPAQAGYLSGLIELGTNTLSDSSIETYFDTGNTPNGFSVGTVIAGIVRVNAFGNSVNTIQTGTHVYAVFSEEVSNIANGIVTLTPTTKAGLTLQALTGNAAIPTGSFYAVFSNPAGYANDVLSQPGATAVTGGAATSNISKLMTYVASTGGGTLEFAVGPKLATDFFESTVHPAGLPLLTDLVGTLTNTTPSQQFASPVFDQSTTANNTGFTFLSNVPATQPSTGVTQHSQVSLTQSGASGGVANAFVPIGFFDGSGAPLAGAVGGGIDNGTFTFDAGPAVEVIPEPASLVLFGVGFVGFAAARFCPTFRTRSRLKS
jgi:hypothetical protein